MSSVIIKTTNNRFIDLDLSMGKHPVSDDILKKTNVNAIIASIKNLVMTGMYERPFHPELSSQVYDLLFEPLTPTIADILQRTIVYCINNFEPRVEVLLVEVSPDEDNSAISVLLVFRIVGTLETIKTTFFLERTL